MRLIGIDIARSTQLFVQDEVRPLSGTYFPESARLVTERYGFTVSPAPADALSGGAKFTGGRLIAGSKHVNIADMTIYSNAVQVTTITNTADSDFVIDDVMSWSISALGFRRPMTIFPRMYESALIVEFEKDTSALIEGLNILSNSYREQFANLYNLDAPTALVSIGIGIDPLVAARHLPPPIPTLLKTEFGLVRRTNILYESERFFAVGPLKTDTHRQLLEQFERAIPE